MVLQRQMTLPIRRDADIYGHVHFRLLGLVHPERAHVRVGNYMVLPAADGLVETDIPIAEQRTAYPVTVNNYTDTLYMPCGEDAVIVLF
jgi:hypothetical protein